MANHLKPIARSRILAVLFLLAALLVQPSFALAQSSSSNAPTGSAGGGLFIALLIVYASRHRAIGGWLLYFYISLYGSFAITLFMFFATYKNLAPSEWTDSFLYVMELLSYVPTVVIIIFETLLGTILLRGRNLLNLNRLRFTLVSLVIANGVSLAIDARYFAEFGTLLLDGFGSFFAAIWTWYFYASKRVKAVFVDHSWAVNYPASRGLSPQTAEEIKRAQKRAIIVAVVAYALFLIWSASLRADPPDAAMLLYPLFVAGCAGLIARYLRFK